MQNGGLNMIYDHEENRVLSDVVGAPLEERRPAYLRTLDKWMTQSMQKVNKQL
jgi:hypothetical protein